MTEDRFKKLETKINHIFWMAVCLIAPNVISGTLLLIAIVWKVIQ